MCRKLFKKVMDSEMLKIKFFNLQKSWKAFYALEAKIWNDEM